MTAVVGSHSRIGQVGADSHAARRLFFALWPDDDLRAAIAKATRAAVERAGGRPVPPRNFHFTLAFLGLVQESRISALEWVAERLILQGGVDNAVDGAGLLAFTLDRIEHWSEPRILCATPRVEPVGAAVLAEALKKALAANDFAPDLRPFHAHATLVRKVARVTHELSMFPVACRFTELQLIESRADAHGSAYSSRRKWPLDGMLQRR